MKYQHAPFVMLLPFLLISSCNLKPKRIPISGSIVGELTHIQYWNKYDEWDLSSVYALIQFDDGTNEKINGASSQIEYSFNYSSPLGMAPGAYELIIIDSSFNVSNTKKIKLGSKKLGTINIINYPYSGTPQELFDSGIALYIIFSFTIFLIVIFVFLHLIKRKKKGTNANDIK